MKISENIFKIILAEYFWWMNLIFIVMNTWDNLDPKIYSSIEGGESVFHYSYHWSKQPEFHTSGEKKNIEGALY